MKRRNPQPPIKILSVLYPNTYLEDSAAFISISAALLTTENTFSEESRLTYLHLSTITIHSFEISSYITNRKTSYLQEPCALLLKFSDLDTLVTLFLYQTYLICPCIWVALSLSGRPLKSFRLDPANRSVNFTPEALRIMNWSRQNLPIIHPATSSSTKISMTF